MAVAGSIERELTVEYLRERLSALLYRYAPAPMLPTPVEESFIEQDSAQYPACTQDRMPVCVPEGTTDHVVAGRLSASRFRSQSITQSRRGWRLRSVCGSRWRAARSPRSR